MKQKIICPNCGMIQTATVILTKPFATYLHTCINCEYEIMESEWNEVKEAGK